MFIEKNTYSVRLKYTVLLLLLFKLVKRQIHHLRYNHVLLK